MKKVERVCQFYWYLRILNTTHFGSNFKPFILLDGDHSLPPTIIVSFNFKSLSLTSLPSKYD